MFTCPKCGKPHCPGIGLIRQYGYKSPMMFEPFTFKKSNDASTTGGTSMIKRIAAITFIFLCTAFAWGVLGATIFQRTYESGSFSESRVASTWGAPQNQIPPAAS